MSYPDFSVLTKKEPEKSLTTRLQQHAGRNADGRLTVRHRGGGAKRAYRILSSIEKKTDMPAKVTAVEYDPNRSAWIALVVFEDGEKAYIVAPEGLKVDDTVVGGETADILTGNRMRLMNIPTGVQVHDVEMTPGSRARAVRSAGTSATVLAKEDVYVQVRMPSGEVRRIHGNGFASIGTVSNPSHSAIRIAKAGRTRHMGKRPTVRGKAMHPAAHPHGGGEGVNPVGLKHPKTPWGKPAMGKKTRSNKRTNQFILRRRGSKR
jgi:large subunit ribosomal protein L2